MTNSACVFPGSTHAPRTGPRATPWRSPARPEHPGDEPERPIGRAEGRSGPSARRRAARAAARARRAGRPGGIGQPASRAGRRARLDHRRADAARVVPRPLDRPPAGHARDVHGRAAAARHGSRAVVGLALDAPPMMTLPPHAGGLAASLAAGLVAGFVVGVAHFALLARNLRLFAAGRLAAAFEIG